MKLFIQKLWILMAMVWVSISASAYDFEVDGVRYNIISHIDLTVETTESPEVFLNNTDTIYIPNEIIYNNRTLKVIRIGENSFHGSDISSIFMGDSISSIGSMAFIDCKNLLSVVASNIQVIGDQAFENCVSLNTVSFGANIVEIGTKAFRSCESLKEFGEIYNIKRIKEYAFSKSGIAKLTLSPYMELGSFAFEGCKDLYSIDFQCSTPFLPKGLFKDCINLSNLLNFTAPETLSESIFYNCSNLYVGNIISSSNLKRIEANALSNCLFPSEISIAPNINYIGDNAFNGFSGDLILDDSYRELQITENTFNGMNIFNIYLGRNISTWDFHFPSTLLTLKIGSNLTSIAPPKYTKYGSKMGGTPFINCKDLHTIEIMPSSIPLNFSGGGELLREEYSREERYTHKYDYYTKYYSSLFSACPIKKLWINRPIDFEYEVRYTIDDGKYHDIYVSRFDGPFIGLSEIEYLDVDFNGFYYVSIGETLKNLSIGLNVDNIPDMSCCDLSIINVISDFPQQATSFSSKTYIDGILNIPSGSEKVYREAPVWQNFWNIIEDKSIFEYEGLMFQIISENELQLIPRYNRYEGNVVIPSLVEYGGFKYSVTTIADRCFKNCTQLEGVNIPSSVIFIRKDCFEGCTSLKKLVLMDSDQSILIPSGNEVVSEKDLVTTIDGKSVYYDMAIYEGCFNGLPIESLYLGRNLSSQDPFIITEGGRYGEVANTKYYDVVIYEEPFSKLPRLESLTIGEGVRTLGSSVREIEEVGLLLHTGSFERCDSIKNIFVDAAIPPIGAVFSDSVYSGASLIVPENTETLYKEAEGWKEFENIFGGTEPVLVEDIILNENELSLEIGDTFQLTAEVLPEDATDQTIIWESSSPDSVIVDETGLLTALSAGSATIIARSADGNCEASCLVTVTVEENSVEIISQYSIYTVYNLQGIRILESNDVEDVKQLPSGVYIINGKKVIIK